MKQDVLGVRYDNVTMDEAIAQARALLETDGADYCVTPNAEMAYEALHDERFRDLLNGAALTLPDGAGVVLAAKIRKTPLKQKVAGVEFAARLLSLLEETEKTLYLLGSKPEVGELAAQKMRAQHPRLNIVGIQDGYFTDEQAVIDAVNTAAPDVLFVCLGSPKQEWFMKNHRNELNVRLMIGLGGTLDSFAGTVKRAPRWMIRLQLEWLYRLLREPKRFKRMLRLPKYIWAAFKNRRKG